MTSLAEAYDRHAGAVSRRRIVLGTGLFLAGVLLVVAGIVAGATPLLTDAGYAWYEAREIAGILAGLGVPAVFVGIFAVLPAKDIYRAAAAVGAGLAVLGVALFEHSYPYGWGRVPTTEALFTVGVYFVGSLVTFWCLFVAVATFKRRNDPGGTVTLQFTRGGETHTVEVAAADAAEARQALGSTDGGPAASSPGSPGITSGVEAPDRGAEITHGGGAASDGGAATADVRTPGDDGHVMGQADEQPSNVDRYCGNCEHFQHVRTDRGIQPHCGHHDEVMDDMDACSEWSANRPGA